MTNNIVKDILNYIDININNEISIDNISKKLCYDKSYIMKLFKKEIGLSIISYVNMIRIINSINMFESNDSFLKICMFNGFNSLEYYSETFKIITGVSPSTYKKYLLKENISKLDYLLINKFILRTSTYLSYVNQYRNGIKNKNTYKLLLEKKVA